MHPRLTYTFFCLFICTGMLSCKEEYKNIDPRAFNNKIKDKANIRSAEELICAYDTTLRNVLHSNAEKLNIVTRTTATGLLEITAIISIFDDDELAGQKIIMTTDHKKNQWRVLEIRYNWKYFEGYGHTDWGI